MKPRPAKIVNHAWKVRWRASVRFASDGALECLEEHWLYKPGSAPRYVHCLQCKFCFEVP